MKSPLLPLIRYLTSIRLVEMTISWYWVRYKMKHLEYRQNGFTLIEIAIVLLVVTILLGYTIAMFPVQQELKQYRQVDQEMNQVLEAIIGFAQTNGRLPCPAIPDSAGLEAGGGTVNCTSFAGFVPVNTLGLDGDVNSDSLLMDPWGNPYRYYVTDADFFEDADDPDDGDISDFGAAPDGDGLADFVTNGEIRDIGLGDNAIDEDADGDNEVNADGYIDLDPNLIICSGASTSNLTCAGAGSTLVMGDYNLLSFEATGSYNGQQYAGFAGVPVVLISLGKNGSQAPSADELENRGNSQTTTDLAMTAGPSGNEYFLDTDMVFVKRTTGMGSDFDDVIKWISSNTLFSKMIAAGQLP